MPYSAHAFEVLVAGPSDVSDARRSVSDAIETWNQRHSGHMGVVMRPVAWETDIYPDLGTDAQAIINRQLAGRCDAVIAIFADRLGTLTPRGASGTAEEIERFVAEGKPVTVYFSNAPINRTAFNVEQFEKLNTFKELLRKQGLHGSFDSLEHLRAQLDQHLALLGNRFHGLIRAESPEQVDASTGFEPNETDMQVIAAMGRIVFEKGENRVHAFSLYTAPELTGVAQGDIQTSVRVLNRFNLTMLLMAQESADLPSPGYNRYELGLTSNGFELWFLNFARNYARDKQRIASAIVKDGLRTPTEIGEALDLPLLLVNHVIERWAQRKWLVVNPLYDSVSIDRATRPIVELAQSAARQHVPVDEPTLKDQTMAQVPAFRTLAEFVGVDVVALSAFGGEYGDVIAAAIKVSGHTVVQVVAPATRPTWDADTEERFRSAVRRLAKTHPLLGREGPVRLVFDPPQTSAEVRDETTGESVDRG